MPPRSSVTLARVRRASQRDAQLWGDILFSVVKALRDVGWHWDPTVQELLGVQNNLIASIMDSGGYIESDLYEVDEDKLKQKFERRTQIIEPDEDEDEEESEAPPSPAQKVKEEGILQTPVDETRLGGGKEEVTE